MAKLSHVAASIGSPLDLAVLRIIVPAVVLETPEFRDMVEYGSVPGPLRVVPLGFETLLSIVPPNPQLASSIKFVLGISCILSIFGCWTRVSLAVATISAFYGLGLAQIQGTVTHNHHLVWLLALLAASPCADVFSWDSWRKTRQGLAPVSIFAPPTRAHSLAMSIAWMLIAVVFFFPGLWKVVTGGLAWMSTENLRLHMYWKWYQFGELPFVRIDAYPRLCQVLSILAVLFELSFGPLVFFRKTRLLAMIGLAGFHLFTRYFLFIRYPSLWMCYVMFIDWRAVVRYVQDKPVASEPEILPDAKSKQLAPIWIVGLFLLGGSILFGARDIQRGWPFACYPTFEHTPSTLISRLYVELVFDDSRIEELVLPRETSTSRRQKQWGISWSLAGLTDSVHHERLRSFVENLEKRPELAPRFRGAREVRVYRAAYSVFPEDFGKAPIKKDLLAEWGRGAQ